MLKTHSFLIGLTLLLAPALLSCSKWGLPGQGGSAGEQESSGELIPAGPLFDDHISFQFAIYYTPKPEKDPLAELDRLLAAENSPFRRAETLEGTEQEPTLAVRLVDDPQQTYAPPDLESLRYFGRGLTGPQAESLQQTEQALLIDFAYPRGQLWKGLRSAVEITHDLAKSTGGLIWDESTREVFSPEAWRERRIADWPEEVPDVSKYTTIHAYNNGDFARAITLGMDKFGLPDVVVEKFSWSENRSIGEMINLLCQRLAEGATMTKPGDFDLNIRDLKHAKLREKSIESLKSNAVGSAPLRLRKGTPQDGDSPNRLIEITFERGKGPDPHARQEQIVSAFFGWEDTVQQVRHDAELEAASRQARTKLPALRAEFNQGLPPGDFIELKAPFDVPGGGHEYMWVEVTKWRGDTITGLLKNEPLNVPTLHAGQIVKISESKVFDYLRKHTDGNMEGNETGKLLQGR